MTEKKCPDCKTDMEAGFIPDFGSGAVIQMMWHPGDVESSTVLGIKTGSIAYDRSKFLFITAHRCQKCGLIRSYAHETR